MTVFLMLKNSSKHISIFVCEFVQTLRTSSRIWTLSLYKHFNYFVLMNLHSYCSCVRVKCSMGKILNQSYMCIPCVRNKSPNWIKTKSLQILQFFFGLQDAVSQFQSTAAVPADIKLPGSAVLNRKSSQESGTKKSQLQLIAGAIKRKG